MDERVVLVRQARIEVVAAALGIGSVHDTDEPFRALPRQPRQESRARMTSEA
jgi:hypothetical protein